MTSFKNAVLNTPVESRTANGMKTYESSLNACLDLFFNVGSCRPAKQAKNVYGRANTVKIVEIEPMFEKAYAEDRQVALRMAAWARDIRGGTGERETYRNILRHLERVHPNELPQMVDITPEYGRWDDLLVLTSKEGRELAFAKIKAALLTEQNGLCAKWMPRKGPDAVALRNYMGLTPKGYRKTLVTLTNVVETAMCSGNWSNIEYGKIPSLAAARYQKAFGKHDPAGYSAYRAALEKGEAKVNANAVYPYDVLKSMRFGGANEVVKAQWNALPNYMGDANVLPMVDVSGSMTCPVAGNANLSCMDVAISLGLYCSDKATGAFKDMFLTFSERSKIEVLKGDIVSKYNQLSRAEWGMSTNLHSAFDAVLNVAVKNKVSQAEMPEYILIMSDMQFNQCAKYDDRALDMIKRKYDEAGYSMPRIVFWQLNATGGNVPVKYDEKGTALVSGFSPSIMQSILKAEEFNPMSVMLSTVNSERYMQIV